MVIAELQVSESPIQIAETQTCFIPPPCSVCQEFPGTKTGQCIAKFKYTLMTTNRSAYTQYMTDFAMDRRNVWDCCEGSSAKWMNDVYCGVYNSYEGACTNQTGEDMQLACSHLQRAVSGISLERDLDTVRLYPTPRMGPFSELFAFTYLTICS